MSNRRNSLLDLHPAAILGSLAGTRADSGPAPHDAEPGLQPERPRAARRLVLAVLRRGGGREQPVSPARPA